MIPGVRFLTGFHTSRDLISHPFVNNPCLYLGDEMKYEDEIRYEEVAYDANFSYDIQIGNNFENRSKLMTSSF